MKREPAADSAPPAWRLLFGAVALLLIALCGVSSFPEWIQLSAALSGPFSFGDPPSLFALISSLAGAVAAVWLLVRAARGRPPSIAGAAVALVCTGACFADSRWEHPQGRTWASADMRILEATNQLRSLAAARLQHDRAAPTSEAEWEALMKRAVKSASPVHRRPLWPQPYSLVQLKRQNEWPAVLTPGCVLWWVSDDGTSFDLSPVGFSREGEPARLWDDTGHPLVLSNSFDPFTAAAEAPATGP